MRRYITIAIFIAGLSVFLYPIVSNMFATQAHQKTIKKYDEDIEKLDDSEIELVKDKAKEHNEKVKDEPIEFIDPFDNGTEEAGNSSYYDALNMSEAMGRLDIPKINVNIPIYHGSGEDVLSRGVGHMENSSLPIGGTGTHSVLTAHRGLPTSKLFRDLDELEIGDEFYIDVIGETHAYRVHDIQTVLPNETDWLTIEEDKELTTLLTCEPYMINTHRLLVMGEKIPYNPDERQKSDKINWDTLIAGIIGFLLVLALILFFVLRKKRREQVS